MAKTCFQTELGWCAVEWEGSEVTAFSLLDENRQSTDAPRFIQSLVKRVKSHLCGNAQDFAGIPYAWSRVSPFQKSVYQAALKVPSGQLSTYGALAALMGRSPGSSRAVGAALGRNPWPLLVPCHRFVGASGSMTGFSAPGGIETKRRLLAIEMAQLPPSDYKPNPPDFFNARIPQKTA